MSNVEQNYNLVNAGLVALSEINDAISEIQHQIHLLQTKSRSIHLTLLKLRVEKTND